MQVINLFGAPSCGKSTTAAGLFFLMKSEGFKVELVTEYAKQIIWDERQNIFRDQLYITAKQNRCLERLRDKVDWVITDSPLLLGFVYAQNYYQSFPSFIKELWDSYNNINFLLERVKPYVQLGRNQNENQAEQLQESIQSLLRIEHISFIKLKADMDAPRNILTYLKKLV